MDSANCYPKRIRKPTCRIGNFTAALPIPELTWDQLQSPGLSTRAEHLFSGITTGLLVADPVSLTRHGWILIMGHTFAMLPVVGASSIGSLLMFWSCQIILPGYRESYRPRGHSLR